MASNTGSNLFGEDTDSSSDDEAPAATKTEKATKDDDGSSSDDEKQKNKAADDDDAAANDKEKEDDSDEEIKEKSADTPSNNNNSALFGDDDDSSEDDEFDGDDGIVGRKGGKDAKAKEPVGKSMNQKLGLDSDSDDDKEGTKSSSREKEEESNRPWVPPRKMELLDLSTSSTTKSQHNDDDDNQIPNEYHITKLPNVVGINSTPYNAATHDMEKEEEQYRGYVHNMIRWRYKTDDEGDYVRDEAGEPIRESNTRIVKWSDGSYTLHVGQEVLEVDNLDSSIPSSHADESMAGFAGINGYLYVSQKAKIRDPSQREKDGPPKEGEESDDEKMPAKPAGTVLECIAPIVSRFAPRPSSLTSDAHRNLTLAMRQRNVKRARIAEVVTEVDPEKEKMARIKGKDDLAKSKARSSGGGRRSGGGGGGRKRGMNASYLEEEEDYDGVHINRLKRQTMRYDSEDENDQEMDYGDSEEEDEWQSKKKKKRGAAAARAAKQRKMPAGTKEEEESSDEEGEVVFGDDDDDDEEDNAFVKKRGGGGGGAKKAVFDDDDDD